MRIFSNPSNIWAKIRVYVTVVTIQMGKFKEFLKFGALYLAFAGVFGFTIFIMEEGIQLLSFANFSASDTRSYGLMKENLELMRNINGSLKAINKYFLWLIPPQQIGYTRYAQATDQYIKTLEAEIMANQPGLYANQYVSINFKHNSYSKAKNGLYIAKNKKVKVIMTQPPESEFIHITGMARPDPETLDGIVITAE